MKFNLNEAFLRSEYWDKEKTIQQIADENGISTGSVFNHMKAYKIPSRKHLSETSKAKISIANTGRVSARKGVHLSEETKRKMSMSKSGRYTSKTKYGGHSKIKTDGYRRIYIPTHPHSNNDGYVMEHILVMEEHIGRYLNEGEVVHHINHNRIDNRIENLQLMTFKEHSALHMRERWEQKKGVKTY